jgi:hypothetical protein
MATSPKMLKPMPSSLWRPPKQVLSSTGAKLIRLPGTVMLELPTAKVKEGRSSEQSKT